MIFDQKWDDEDDDFDEEAEARSRYGDIFSNDSASQPATDEVDLADPARDKCQTPDDIHEPVRSNLPNYHCMNELTDEHLPDLDFYRADNIFTARSANGWLDACVNNGEQKPLFGEFWGENELSILFSDTGRGKSILAVQIAESIASGELIGPFELAVEKQRVLVFDFEMDDRQFGIRYSCQSQPDSSKLTFFKFSGNLIRARVGPELDIPEGYKDIYDYLASSMMGLIAFTGARIVIVDNITWLNTSTQNTAGALKLMKTLKMMKTEMNLSILVLAHTPKRYGRSPLSINDLQGSRMLANFADNIFAMGESRLGRDLRYIKQLKLRNSALHRDETSVSTLRLRKMPGINPAKEPEADSPRASETLAVQSDCFLGFEFTGHDHERDHTGWQGTQHDSIRTPLIEKAESLAVAGKTQREIADILGVSAATVNRYLKPVDP